MVGVTPGTAGGITTLCRTPLEGQQQQAQDEDDPCQGGHNWAARPGLDAPAAAIFAAPLYMAHRTSDYDVLWQTYAWEGPPPNPWYTFDLSHPGERAQGRAVGERASTAARDDMGRWVR